MLNSIRPSTPFFNYSTTLRSSWQCYMHKKSYQTHLIIFSKMGNLLRVDPSGPIKSRGKIDTVWIPLIWNHFKFRWFFICSLNYLKLATNCNEKYVFIYIVNIYHKSFYIRYLDKLTFYLLSCMWRLLVYVSGMGGLGFKGGGRSEAEPGRDRYFQQCSTLQYHLKSSKQNLSRLQTVCY